MLAKLTVAKKKKKKKRKKKKEKRKKKKKKRKKKKEKKKKKKRKKEKKHEMPKLPRKRRFCRDSQGRFEKKETTNKSNLTEHLPQDPKEDEDEDNFLVLEMNDFDLEQHIPTSNQPASKRVLAWDSKSVEKFRSLYTGDSRATFFRRKQEEGKLKQAAQNTTPITNFFHVSKVSQPIPTLSIQDVLEMCLAKLKEKDLSKFEEYRFVSIRGYCLYLLEGKSRIEASQNVSKVVFGKGKFAASQIRKWFNLMSTNQELPISNRGKHSKVAKLLWDEDFSSKCIQWLRTSKPEKRGPLQLKKYIEEVVLPSLTGNDRNTISKETCSRYMKEWGFEYKPFTQNIYMDGHERNDVVEYRREFVARMIERRKSMTNYDEDLNPIQPNLSNGARRIVLVCQDESTYYTNDLSSSIWMEEGHPILRKKGQGQAIMVSDLICDCHGPLRIKEEHARVKIKNKL